MKKQIFMGALAAMMFTACSNDELTNVNHDGDEIAFNVVTNLSTRAADVYCNNNLPSDFKVWATFDNKTYINGDLIKKTADNKWENQSGTRYWPDGEVKFFAHKNAGDAFNWNEGAPKIENFTVPTTVSTQQDLIYAVKSQNKTAAGADGKVTLNFRHALSQIVFQAKNTNKTLHVEISGVSICKVGNQNTFTYPTTDTDNNYVNHEGTTDTESFGSHWATLTGGTTNYSVTFNAVDVPGSDNATPVSLTSTNDDGKEFSSTAMLLLPQTTTKWDVNSATAEGKPAEQTGTYFLVKCKIWNVSNENGLVDKTNDTYLWGNAAAAKDIAIPVALNWEEGKKYVYTFVFGKGNGGYNPDPTDPDPDPTPVLVPITFNVTVDDFVLVEDQNIEMDKPAN